MGNVAAYSFRHSALKTLLRESPAHHVSIARIDLADPAFIFPGTGSDVDVLGRERGELGMQSLAIELLRLLEQRKIVQRRLLIRVREAIAVGIGARFNHAVRSYAHHHRSRAAVPLEWKLTLCPRAASSATMACGVRSSRIRSPAIPGVVVEARNQMPCLDSAALPPRPAHSCELDHVQASAA